MEREERGGRAGAQGATEEQQRWLRQLGRFLYAVERGKRAVVVDRQARRLAERRALVQGGSNARHAAPAAGGPVSLQGRGEHASPDPLIQKVPPPAPPRAAP